MIFTPQLVARDIQGVQKKRGIQNFKIQETEQRNKNTSWIKSKLDYQFDNTSFLFGNVVYVKGGVKKDQNQFFVSLLKNQIFMSTPILDRHYFLNTIFWSKDFFSPPFNCKLVCFVGISPKVQVLSPLCPPKSHHCQFVWLCPDSKSS